MDKLNSEFVQTGIPGSYYVTVKLQDGLKYDDYTAKIKGTSKELVYDDYVKKFYYTDYKALPSSVTVIINEKSTGRTQEILLPKTKL